MQNIMEERKIPRTMSTQHPDNAFIPIWCKDSIIQGDYEVYEAYFAYSSLGCHEVMWDSEGKDVDTHVVRKLLNNHADYFTENIMGKDVFLTYRIPNPKVEIAERKIVVETLENIPISHDVASTFYKKDILPIFEVILPLTTHGEELVWLYNYYKKAVVEIENLTLEGLTKVKDWVGSFKPNNIELIPLIEDMNSLLKIDEIIEQYINKIKTNYMRVFIARSDPALNYSLVNAIILSKLALSKLKSLEERKNTPIYPIIGVGTMPFRGHLSPNNLDGFLNEYRGIYTATIQSSLKYDYPLEEVRKMVETLNKKLPHGESTLIEPHEEKNLLKVLEKFKSRYQTIVEDLAPLINSLVPYIPERRARKLHIGLFGYSRDIGKARLPRAIPFAAVLYSLGIPPEFIGFEALSHLSEDEWSTLEKCYLNMKQDLKTIAGYLSYQNINILIENSKLISQKAKMEEEKLKGVLNKVLQDLKTVEENLGINLGPRTLTQKRYENTISNFVICYLEQNNEEAKEHLEEAARIRKCLG